MSFLITTVLQVMFHAVRQGSFRCLRELFLHPNLPIHHRSVEIRNTILHEILEHSYLYQEIDDENETQLFTLINAVCSKFNTFEKKGLVFERPKLVDRLAGNDNVTALHLAAKCDEEEIVSCLLNAGACPNVRDVSSNMDDALRYDNPLAAALKARNLGIAHMLIKAGASMHHEIDLDRSSLGCTLGQYVMEQNFTPAEVAELFYTMVQHCTTNQRMHQDDVVLLFRHGDTKCTKFLLERNIDIFYRQDDNAIPYLEFILGRALVGNYEHLAILLDNMHNFKVNLNAAVLNVEDLKNIVYIDEEYMLEVLMMDFDTMFTPLQSALRCGAFELVNLLLRHGVDTDEKGQFDFPPICHIMEYVQVAVDALKCYVAMLRYGCNLNVIITMFPDDLAVDMTLLDYYLACRNIFVCQILAMIGVRRFSLFRVDRSAITSSETFHDHVMADKITDIEIDSFVVNTLSVVPTLYQSARTSIRTCMSRNIEKKIQQLELPTHIKAFLNLEELDDLESMYREYENKYDLHDLRP